MVEVLKNALSALREATDLHLRKKYVLFQRWVLTLNLQLQAADLQPSLEIGEASHSEGFDRGQ